ncbi:MAG: OmpA family protein [Rhodospirillales bacterium]|nr:OmpA family protein [Rhodospirillales bacterium]
MTRQMKTLNIALISGVLVLGACTNPNIEAAQKLDIRGSDARSEAAREYRRLAYFEDKVMWDKASAIAFSEKALAAADGRMTTETALDQTSDQPTPAEIADAYQALNRMMAAGADRVAPKATGQAMARLDCWKEQAREGDQPLDIGFCKDGFQNFAAETAATLQAAGKPVPSQITALKSFSVTFPLGSSMPSTGAQAVLDAAAAYARSGQHMRIVLGGHADKSGTASRNRDLSEARAERVAAMLRARGVSAGQISTIGFGETYPRIMTPDGQRSSENRRVEIVIGPDRVL